MNDFPPHQEVTRELSDLSEVQIVLTGWEVHSLIVAVQGLKARNSHRLGRTMITAEVAARKLHKAFLPCPNTYTLLAQGWKLLTNPDLTEPDVTSEKMTLTAEQSLDDYFNEKLNCILQSPLVVKGVETDG